MYSKEIFDEVISLRKSGKSLSQISQICKLPRSTVQKMISPSHIRKQNNPGHPKVVNSTIKNKIRRLSNTIYERGERITSTKLKDLGNFNICTSTIRKTLRGMKYNYKIQKQKLILSEYQKRNRLDFIKNWINHSIDFSKVIFTDEKKFSLDGPDNFYSWIPNGKSYQKCQHPFGGGGIMVYGAVLSDGTVYLSKFDKTVNSEEYITKVADVISRFINDDDHIIMQDNARPHVSKVTKQFFENSETKLLPWPPYSPDLNIMENIWHMLSEKIYDGPQCRSKTILWDKIQEAQQFIIEHKNMEIKNLFVNYIDRLFNVIRLNGEINV